MNEEDLKELKALRQECDHEIALNLTKCKIWSALTSISAYGSFILAFGLGNTSPNATVLLMTFGTAALALDSKVGEKKAWNEKRLAASNWLNEHRPI